MKKERSLLILLILCVHIVIPPVPVFAEEYKLEQNSNSADEGILTYKDSRDGIDAFLVFHEFNNKIENKDGFASMCQVSAVLKEADTGTVINRAKLALREETGNNKLSIPQALVPSTQESMQTKLFVSNKGTRHYVLVALIEGLGLREFNFHHTFN